MARIPIDELIALVESRGNRTAVDRQTLKDYEEAKFLRESEERQNERIARAGGINPDAVKGMSRRDVQRVVEEMRTREYNKRAAKDKETYGTTERGLIEKVKGKGAFRKDEEIGRMAFSDPDALSGEADELEALFFPRGRAHSTRANAKDIAAKIDAVRERAATGPKSADVTAQRAAARLPEFEALSIDEAEKKIMGELSRAEMTAGEAATLRQALKPKAALEEEEIMARMRPEAEAAARVSDVYSAADEILAPLMDATKLSLPEVRARKRLATELQKRAVDPFDFEGMRNPRALPARRRVNNPAEPGTVVNPEGAAPGPLENAELDFEAAKESNPPTSVLPVVPTPYDLATQSRKRKRDRELDLFDSGIS